MKLGIDPDQVKGFLEKQEAESLYRFAKKYSSLGPVSYTHLTLPTIYSV